MSLPPPPSYDDMFSGGSAAAPAPASASNNLPPVLKAAPAPTPVAQAQSLKFFKKVKKVDTERDYSILVDMSGSMNTDAGGDQSRWEQAYEAVSALATNVVNCDPDGVTLYFFNNRFEKIENVNTAEAILQQFGEKEPGGGTKLAAALADAVRPDGVDGAGKRRPETILIISDGEPSDRAQVEQVIIDATKQYMQVDEDLSITFIQVGDDKGAEQWLASLDDDLKGKGARFDIVDVMGFSDFKGTSFSELVRLSLAD